MPIHTGQVSPRERVLCPPGRSLTRSCELPLQSRTQWLGFGVTEVPLFPFQGYEIQKKKKICCFCCVFGTIDLQIQCVFF